MSFDSSQYSYGGSHGRYLLAEVVNRKDDPEQAGRCQLRIVGYQNDKGTIPDKLLCWARPATGLNSPQHKGVGGPVTGLLEGSIVIATFTDAAQQDMQMHSVIGASMDENGNIQKADHPPHNRDEEHGGGDKRWDAKAKEYTNKSITEYARDEAPNAFGETQSKDASLDENQSWSLGQHQYA